MKLVMRPAKQFDFNMRDVDQCFSTAGTKGLKLRKKLRPGLELAIFASGLEALKVEKH
jgi:hypothetical protein